MPHFLEGVEVTDKALSSALGSVLKTIFLHLSSHGVLWFYCLRDKFQKSTIHYYRMDCLLKCNIQITSAKTKTHSYSACDQRKRESEDKENPEIWLLPFP